MKTIAVIACLALSGCAGTSLTWSSPWGDVSSIDGVTVVTPKPVVWPSK